MSTYLPQLDILRTFAVLLVFLGHLEHTLGYQHVIRPFSHFGVELFFIHTALVLFLSLERNGLDYKAFYLRRVFRIYPLSVVVILVVVLFHIPISSWTAQYTGPGWPAIVSNLLLIQNLTGHHSVLDVLWSLPLEVQMYALLPILFSLYKQHLNVYVIWGLAVVFAIAEFLWLPNSSFFLYAPCFCSGIVAYQVNKRYPGTIPFSTTVWGFLGILALNRILTKTSLPLAFIHPVVCLLVGLLIGRSRAPRTDAIQRISTLIARYSYGIYLSHLPLMWLCFKDRHGIREFAIFIVAAVLVPILAFHCVEAPCIRLGARLTKSIKLQPSFIGMRSKVSEAAY